MGERSHCFESPAFTKEEKKAADILILPISFYVNVNLVFGEDTFLELELLGQRLSVCCILTGVTKLLFIQFFI